MITKTTVSGSVSDVYSGATQGFPGRMPRVGSEVIRDDGTVYRLAKTTSVVAAGDLLKAPAGSAGAVAGAHAVGAEEVVVTIASIAAGDFADGYLSVNGGMYRVRANTATESGAITVSLMDRLTVALVDTDDCYLIPFRYNGVAASTATSDVVGVALSATTGATASNPVWFFVQVAGKATVKLTGAAASAGLPLKAGAGVAEPASAATDRVIGHTSEAKQGDYVPVDLCL